MEDTKIGNVCPAEMYLEKQYGPYDVDTIRHYEHTPGLRIDSSLRNIRIYICTQCGCLFAVESKDE
jgi:hypothetical protein